MRRSGGDQTQSASCLQTVYTANWYRNSPTSLDAFRCTGKVGIGTSTPKSRLDVVGNMRIGLDYASSSSGLAPTNGLLIEGHTGMGTTTPTSMLDVAGNMKIGSNYAISSSNAPSNGLLIEGTVGIGTMDPFSKLDVVGNMRIGTTYAASNSLLAPADGMLVEGQMGIGTTSPVGKFEVVDAAGLNSMEIRANPSNSSVVYPSHRGITLGNDDGGNNRDGSFNFWIDPTQHNSGSTSGFNFNGQSFFNTYNYMSITSAGKVGIGTISPLSNLDVVGNMRIGANYATNTSNLAPSNGLLVEGQVGIGTTTFGTSGTYMLAVKGNIIATEVKVELYNNWDKVFAPDYNLLSIKDLKNFLTANHHLPDIQSYDEMRKDEGVNVGDMQMKLLRKVEELTLYIIEQDKRIETLEREVKK